MHAITTRYHFARALFVALYPKPNVTFLLHEAPEVLVTRKPDLDVETMREMQTLYASMAERWGFIPVRADVPPLAGVTGLEPAASSLTGDWGRSHAAFVVDANPKTGLPRLFVSRGSAFGPPAPLFLPVPARLPASAPAPRDGG